jgi:hypothetical protein
MKTSVTLLCVMLLFVCRDLFAAGASHLYLLYRVHLFLSDVVLINAIGYGISAVLVSLMLTGAVISFWIVATVWIDRKTREYS